MNTFGLIILMVLLIITSVSGQAPAEKVVEVAPGQYIETEGTTASGEAAQKIKETVQKTKEALPESGKVAEATKKVEEAAKETSATAERAGEATKKVEEKAKQTAPGFETVFAALGLLAVAFIALSRRN